MTRHIEIFRTVWNGVTIEIRWEPRWLNLSNQCCDPAHLEIECIDPMRAPLPITETGYRSHFTSPEMIAACGGPIAYVEAWLETESQTPDWRKSEQEYRQFALPI